MFYINKTHVLQRGKTLVRNSSRKQPPKDERFPKKWLKSLKNASEQVHFINIAGL